MRHHLNISKSPQDMYIISQPTHVFIWIQVVDFDRWICQISRSQELRVRSRLFVGQVFLKVGMRYDEINLK